MKRAIYPGSFDPITKGHVDIIERASKMFDEVIVVLMENPTKTCLFSKDERLAMNKYCCKHLDNVTCDIGEGLTIHYAQANNASIMIRGIRAVQDYEYELQTATANMMINERIETCFLMSKPEYSFLSSSSVKEIASFGEDVSKFVDEHVANELKKKYEIK